MGWSAWPATIAAGAVALSCSQGQNQQPSPPETGQYQIDFPSVLAAVDSDTMEVLQFDATQSGADCLSLMVARQAHAALPSGPALLADTGTVDTCSFVGDGGTLGVSYGQRSLLVVTQRCGQDLLLGCAQTDFEATSQTVTVYIAQSVLDPPLPANGCTSLAQKCSGQCSASAPTCGDAGG